MIRSKVVLGNKNDRLSCEAGIIEGRRGVYFIFAFTLFLVVFVGIGRLLLPERVNDQDRDDFLSLE